MACSVSKGDGGVIVRRRRRQDEMLRNERVWFVAPVKHNQVFPAGDGGERDGAEAGVGQRPARL